MISTNSDFPRSSGQDTDTDNTIAEDKLTGNSTPVPPADVSQDEEKNLSTEAEAAPTPEFSRSVNGWKWVLVCGSIYVTGFLYGLDNTIAADIQGAVVERFHEVSQLSWLGTGFPLGSIATILTL